MDSTNSATVGKNVGTLKPLCPCHANTLIEHLLAVREDIRKLTRLIKAYLLRPGPGRPRHPKVTLASKLRSQGKSWTKVFTLCLPDRTLYDSSEAYITAKERLKKAVRQRHKRMESAALASSPAILETNSPKFV